MLGKRLVHGSAFPNLGFLNNDRKLAAVTVALIFYNEPTKKAVTIIDFLMFSVMKTLFRALRVTSEYIFGPVELVTLFSIIMKKITVFSALSDFSSEQNFCLVKVYPLHFYVLLAWKNFNCFELRKTWSSSLISLRFIFGTVNWLKVSSIVPPKSSIFGTTTTQKWTSRDLPKSAPR